MYYCRLSHWPSFHNASSVFIKIAYTATLSLLDFKIIKQAVCMAHVIYTNQVKMKDKKKHEEKCRGELDAP